jgi:hypothetical protein
MGILAWFILLAAAAALATAAQLTLFADRKSSDYDWIYIASGGVIGGFTGHVWYSGFGAVIDGLNVVPALAGLFIGGAVVEIVYRSILRPRQDTT